MVLPSLFVPILSIANTISPLTAGGLGCYGQNPPNETQISIVTYKECKAAAANIPLGRKALAPLTFGRNKSAGFQTPYHWTYGICQIGIDVLDQDVEETATFAAIFKRAFDLLVECVIKPPHFGGLGLVGDDRNLKVTVRQR